MAALRRAMTDDECAMARALARVTMVPGIPSKRFARDLACVASGDAQITERQAEALYSLVLRYRRQIAPPVVALARAASEATCCADTRSFQLEQMSAELAAVRQAARVYLDAYDAVVPRIIRDIGADPLSNARVRLRDIVAPEGGVWAPTTQALA